METPQGFGKAGPALPAQEGVVVPFEVGRHPLERRGDQLAHGAVPDPGNERIDGLGYPRGIQGDEIPVISRIISVADTYDVMTARDSYREPVSSIEAIEELRRVDGAEVDVEVEVDEAGRTRARVKKLKRVQE